MFDLGALVRVRGRGGFVITVLEHRRLRFVLWRKGGSRLAMTVSRGRALGKLKRRFKVPTHGLIDKKFPPPPVEVDGQAH